jgi:hypothetical protein
LSEHNIYINQYDINPDMFMPSFSAIDNVKGGNGYEAGYGILSGAVLAGTHNQLYMRHIVLSVA